MDWEQAKIDYITNPQESYQSIAARYGVSKTQVGNRAKDEGWRELRGQHLDSVCTKTVEAIGDKRVERMTRLQNAADKLLMKIEAAIDGVDSNTLIRNAKLPRALTGAVIDLKNIMDLKSDADMEEQEARIAKLRADMMTEEQDKSITLVIEGGDESWAH